MYKRNRCWMWQQIAPVARFIYVINNWYMQILSVRLYIPFHNTLKTPSENSKIGVTGKIIKHLTGCRGQLIMLQSRIFQIANLHSLCFELGSHLLWLNFRRKNLICVWLFEIQKSTRSYQRWTAVKKEVATKMLFASNHSPT